MIFFQHAAEVEKKQNASEVQKSMGSVIQYGITIQVGRSYFFLKSQLPSIDKTFSLKLQQSFSRVPKCIFQLNAIAKFSYSRCL